MSSEAKQNKAKKPLELVITIVVVVVEEVAYWVVEF
jgi:hypothetical protein